MFLFFFLISFLYQEQPFAALLGEHKGNIQPLMPYVGLLFTLQERCLQVFPKQEQQ